MTSQSEDDNMETEMHEHEMNESCIFSEHKCADQIDQTTDNIRSCIDGILENINLADKKESELVDGDLNLNNRKKLDANNQELHTLDESPVIDKVKTENNCCNTFKIDYTISENSENVTVREFCVSFKPLNKEIDNSSEQYNDACFNSEKGGCNSVVVDISLKDTGKIDERSPAIENVNLEMQKHGNIEDTLSSGSNCFIDGDRVVEKVNVGTESCLENVSEILNLTNKETNQITNNRERSDEVQKSYKFGGGLEDERSNRNTFKVKAASCLNEIKDNFNKPINIEINNSSMQNIVECCNSEIKGADILLDCGRGGGTDRAANKTEPETQNDKNVENSVDGSSCIKNASRKVIEMKDDVWSRNDMILKKFHLIKIETIPIREYVNPNNREEIEAVGKKIQLVENLENTELGVDHNFDMFKLNPDISADIKTFGVEINDPCIQNVDRIDDSEKNNFNSNINDISLKDTATKDCKKTDSNGSADDAICEVYEHENIKDNGEKDYSYNGKRVGETNDCLKLCHSQLKLIEKKSELKEKHDDFIANSGKLEYGIKKSCILHESTEKDRTRSNICVSFENTVGEKCENFTGILDTDKQDTDVCQCLEKHFNSDINDANLKDIAKKDYEITDSSNASNNAVFEVYEHQNIDDNSENNYSIKKVGEMNDNFKLCHPQLKSFEKSELKENNADFMANNCGKSKSVIQESCMFHENTGKDQRKGDICVATENNVDENRKNSIRVLDIDKQNAEVRKNLEDDSFNANVNVKKITLTEDHGKKELSNALKHQKSIHCDEENCFNGGTSEIREEISSCLDSVIKNINVAEEESALDDNDITVNNREKCKTVYQKVNILRNTVLNEEKRKETRLEVTAFKSKKNSSDLPCTYSEDLDVIVISSTEEDNYDFEKLTHTFNGIGGENDLNTDARDKFHDELDNEVEILKAQCSDIEKKLNTAKNISNEEKYKCSLKVKKELSSCMQSLENLSVSLKNKWLQDKSKILKEQAKPSCSYHQQHPEKHIETPIDKYRYRSQAFTRLTKISHHHYEFNSQMPPWEAVKVSHKYKKRPENFSDSEEETRKNLHKKKCVSQYSFEHGFQQSPEKKIKSCSKKCCLSKNCASYRKARETEFHSYRNELDCFGGRGGFSKSFIAHRELTFSKSNPRDYTNLSHSNPTLKMSNPTDKYKSSVLRPCSKKKISERQYGKGINFHKCGREHDFNNDLSDSSEISGISDELSPIHLDHYSAQGKYCKSKHAKSVKKNEISSKKDKLRKRIKEKQYETDEISMSSIDSDTSIEVIETSGKRHKDKTHSKYNVENKRAHNREMDFNKHASKKGDMIEPTQASFTDSNIDEKWKQNYFDKEKQEEISSSESTTPVLENTKKRKKKASELPFKQAKISSHSDLRNFLNNKYNSENSKVKFHSHIASRSRSTSPVESNTRSPYKLVKTKQNSQNIFKNKYNSENCKAKLQSYIVSPSSNLPVAAMKYKNEDVVNYSPQTFGEQTKETKKRKNKTIGSFSTQSSEEQITGYNDRKTTRPDDKHMHKMWDNVAQRSKNEADEEYSEGEMNNIKGMESFVSFLKKKKGKYLTPPYTMLINQELEKERESKYGPDSIYEANRENKQQKNRTDLVYPGNVPVKSKKTVRSPQISPKMTEQNVTKPVKKKLVEDKNDVSASSGKFDLFKQLNREIRKKKNVKKSVPATSTVNADFENKKTFSKPNYPAYDDDTSFHKIKGFSTKFERRESPTKSKNFLPDFQEDNGTWSD